jgi:actin-related protein 5
MAPSAIDPPTQVLGEIPTRKEKTYPPAKIFQVKEVRFEKHISPQPDGREKALTQPQGGAAIVIDNGAKLSSY